MGNTPFFSILIPTRNRSHLLKTALECLRRQTFSDFEVIVSDDHSEDDTVETVRLMGDERFRLVQPPSRLTMADHYEFVSTQALGTYRMFSPERIVFYSQALESLQAAIEKTGASLIGYNADTYQDSEPDGRVFHQFMRRGEIKAYDTKALLRACYELRMAASMIPIATPAGSTCHRDLVEKIRARGNGRLVNRFIPDTTYPVAVLAMTDTFYYLDKSIKVAAGHTASVGRNLGNRRGDAFRSLIGDESTYCTRVPCPGLLLNINLVADDLLMLKELFSEELKEYELSLGGYMEYISHEIDVRCAQGVDVSQDRKVVDARLEALLQSYPDLMRDINRYQQFRYSNIHRNKTGLPKKEIPLGDMSIMDAVVWSEQNPPAR